MRPTHLWGWRRLLWLVPLAAGVGGTVLLGSAWWCPGVAAGLSGHAYLPLVAKPLPTPTVTATATPVPPPLQVRVEKACSNFTGGSRQDPNGEYVCFRNYDWRAADMTGWLVRDAANHTYTFPPFVLSPGAIVRLYSGPGSNTATELHWARGLIWNNDHDAVYLYDAFGNLIDSYVY